MAAPEEKQSDADRDFEMGLRHWRGDGVAVDGDEAAKCWARAARAGHIRAAIRLSELDTFTRRAQVTDDDLVSILREAPPEDVEATVARCGLIAKSPSMMIANLRVEIGALWELVCLADSGHAGAQFHLGGCFDFGTCVPHDAGRAAELYRQAAEGGSLGAVCIFAFCLCNGEGVPRDVERGHALYQRAADACHPLSMYNLGIRFAEGLGVPRDVQKATLLFRRAAEHGCTYAQLNYGLCIKNGWTDDDSEDAIVWMMKAADKGYDHAVSLLSEILVERALAEVDSES